MFKKKIGILLASTVLVGSLAIGCGSKSSDNSKVTVSGSSSIGPVMEVVAEKFKEKNEGISVEIQQVGSSAGIKNTIEGTSQIGGSSSIGPVMEVVAEKFKEKNEGISVEIQQVGSSAGIKNTIEGTSQIGMASRDLKDEEKSAGLKETEIALDGISIITNKSNEVKNLTLQQIKDIYTGKITNWKEVGGKDAPIVVLSREDGSGTRDGFQEKVGFESEELVKDAQISDGSGNIKSTVEGNENVGFESEELVKDAQISDGSGNIKSTVEGNENAIGYISYGYVDDAINALTVDGVELTAENVKSDKYPIARPFILVNLEDKVSEEGTKLIDFILSDEGQSIMEDKGFIRIK